MVFITITPCPNAAAAASTSASTASVRPMAATVRAVQYNPQFVQVVPASVPVIVASFGRRGGPVPSGAAFSTVQQVANGELSPIAILVVLLWRQFSHIAHAGSVEAASSP